MKKQILSTLLSVSMFSTLLTFPTTVVNAEDTFTVTTATPADGSKMVSAIDDVVITFSENVDKATIADGINFSGSETYQLYASKNKVTMVFDKELAYLTDYTISLDEDLLDVNGNALTPYEFSFETEYNPLNILWYSDFEGNPADELAKFTIGADQRAITVDDNIYDIVEDPKDPSNHLLKLIDATNYGTLGYYPIFKGSNTWEWYTAEFDVEFSSPSRLKWLIKGVNYGKAAAGNRCYTGQIDAFNYKTFQGKVIREDNNFTVTETTALSGHPGKRFPVSFVFTGDGGTTNAAMNLKGINSEDVAITATNFYIEQGASGIFGFNAGGSNNGPVYIDNLVVKDTGYCPTFVTSRKNIENGLVRLLFPTAMQEISAGSKEDVKVTLNGVEVERTIEYSSTYPRYLTITIVNPQPNAEYEITVPTTTFKTGNASTTVYQNLSNDKVFTVKTPYVDSALSVVSTTPAMGATDVAVKSNVTIDFSAAVDFDTLEGNITVEGAPDFTIEEIDEDTVALVFDERLDYGKSYTVTLSNAILSADGEEFSGYSFNFTTLESNFALSNSSIADGSRDVSVLDDLAVYFNDAVDFDTLEGNITVSPEADFNLVEIDNGAILEFKDALEYYTNYTVNFSGDIATVDGMPLSEKAITFKTAPDMGKALFYENFEGDEATAQARFTEIGSENRDSSENFYVGGGVLNLPSYYSGAANQADKTIAQIVGSETWGNIELDFDAKIPDFRNIATSVGGSIDVRLRQGTYGAATSWINFHLGDSSNNGILKASMSRNNLNVVDPYISDVSIDYTDATTTPDWINNKLLFTGAQGNAIVNYEMNAYGKTATASFDSKNAPEGYRETYVLPTGSVAFSTLARTSKTLIDNILVNDLDFAVTAENIKNNEGTATLIFSKGIDTATVAENIKVYDGNNEVSATVAPQGTTKVDVSVDVPVSGKVYTIKVLEGLTTADGKTLPSERSVNMSVKLDLTISNLAIKSNGVAINSLTRNTEIYGTADVSYIGADAQSVTLILAVYDSYGNLHAVKTNKQTVTEGTVKTLETAKYTLPSNVTGFTAQAFCWDDLVNIKPLSDSVVIPQ